MNSKSQKIIININDSKYLSWKLCLRDRLKNIKSNNIEIDCKNLDLSCSDISELIAIASQFNCKIISFFSLFLNCNFQL